MSAPWYWKTQHVVGADGGEIERSLIRTDFASGGHEHELPAFGGGSRGPAMLISPLRRRRDALGTGNGGARR